MISKVPSASQSLLSFFEGYFWPKKPRSKSKETERLYRNTIRNFERSLGRAPIVADLIDDNVSGHMTWHMAVQENTAGTANKERSQLLALANAASRKGLLQWLDVPIEPEPERTPMAWLESELAALYASCKAEPGFVNSLRASDWWCALFLVIWDTGERIGAMMALRWDHVSLESGWVHIPAEVRKGKRRDVTFQLHAETITALRAILEPKRKLIFPWSRAPTDIYRFYNAILERAGLPTDRKSKFHRMRKSVASHAEAAGMNATQILDHANRRTTMSYLDPRIVRTRQPADVLFRPGAQQQPPMPPRLTG